MGDHMRVAIFLALAVVFGFSCPSFAQQGGAPGADAAAMQIVSVTDRDRNFNPDVAIGERLVVTLSGTGALDPAAYLLFIDGKPIAGLDDTILDSKPKTHALVFDLRLNNANAAAWKAILGAPTQLKIPVTVALGAKSSQTSIPTITGDGIHDKFNLVIASTWRLVVAVLFILFVIGIVWLGWTRTSLFKDNLLPQIAPSQQPYSLGRYQMAFWFTLIFISFITLYIGLLDYHTISSQALVLMGISAVTGGGAIIADVVNDTPEDWTNRGLIALGFKSYDDVVRTRQEIADRQTQLKGNIDATLRQKLTLEIQDRQLLLRTYETKINPFVTAGWWKDMTTDSSGNALHRIQVLVWTWALGIVFVIGVYTDLAMPQFDTTVLLLTGISGGSYAGFKFREARQ